MNNPQYCKNNLKIGLVSIYGGKVNVYDEDGRLVRTEDAPE